MKYPDYVKQFRPKGTVVKKINGIFYAYYATSKRVPDKSYPVQVVTGIAGKIDEMGFHPVTSTRVELDEVVIRECGFTNYMLLFEDEYVAQNRNRSRKDSRVIYRSLIVYLSPNSYLNEDKSVKILPIDKLVMKYKIGIPKQITAVSKMIEVDVKKLEPLKHICNVRIGGKLLNSSLTEEHKRIMKELGVSEDEIR